MEFVDHAPPAAPSLEQQRNALQKGQGRAVQWAMNGRLNPEPLLEACLHDQRHDSQIDAPRGDWLWNTVRTVGAAERFRVPILHALYELADERSAEQLCQLARYYAATGDDAFRSRLYEIVERRPFPSYCPSLGEEEIILLDGEPAFLFAARMRGKVLAEPGECDDGSLMDFAVKRFGEGRVGELLDASSDVAIRRFRDCWRRDKLHRAEQGRRRSAKERMAAVSVAEIIREAAGEGKCYWFAVWGKHADEADLRLILQRLWSESEPQVVVKYLRVFSGRALPDFDARLIELSLHDDAEVRERAFKALEQNTHPLIRDFALTELQGDLRDESLAGLFINNYRQGDEERILEATKLPSDACQLHWLFYDIIEVLEKHPEADCSRLGVVCYALTPCVSCRCKSVRLLMNQQAAPQWLKEECRHDSGKDCRELFGYGAASAEAG